MDLTKESITAVVPPGWDVRIGRDEDVRPPSISAPFLHAANFALPSRPGSLGGSAYGRMGPGDVFIALLEYPGLAGTPRFSALGFPARLRARCLARTRGTDCVLVKPGSSNSSPRPVEPSASSSSSVLNPAGPCWCR